MKPVLGIGWDVGGWMGNNHGWAVCRWEHGNELEWLGSPIRLKMDAGGHFELGHVLGSCWGLNEEVLDEHKVVVAVDAPLGFPASFQKLLNRESVDFEAPNSFFESALAFRQTDQHVHDQIDAKPLSAAFDKLGNNATAAMVHVRRWEKRHGFSVVPQTKVSDPDRLIIEVYPALAKDRESGQALPRLRTLLPGDLRPKTDEFDAAICAVHAARFGADRDFNELPPLVEPELVTDVIKEEGWIYYWRTDMNGRTRGITSA